MNILKIVKHFASWAVFLAAALAASASQAPNIIYILVDDLGYGDVSYNGQTHFETPNIDALAADGMVFTQHYSGASVCAPSRSALLTGKHTGHAPVRGNAEVMPEGQQPMPADTYTMAHMLKDTGYTTGLFGKWGLGYPGSVSEPLKMGFDRFYGFNCQRLAHHYYPYFLWDDDRHEVLWGNFGLETEDYAPTLIHEQAMQFIEDNQETPFFLYYAVIQPHAEMFAPEEKMEKYRGKFLPESSYKGTDGGPNFRKFAYGSQSEAHAAFAGMVSSIDDYVGDIVAKLEALGIADNTLIIFTSDNGPHQEAGHNPDFFDSNGPLRGYKRDLYEGGLRVPMVARWPGQVPAGAVTDHISAFWDVLPTVADLSGTQAPDDIDGISFLPTLLGDDDQAQHDYLYWEFHELKGRVAIRKGDWKGVRYNVALDADSPLELYNLAEDIGEANNVADQHPEIVAELNALIKGARTVSPVADFNFPLERTAVTAGRAHEMGQSESEPAVQCASTTLAQTPPMGWNSFDSYGVYLHEEAAMANLEAMAEKLKPHGYEYFVIDNGWFGEYELQEGTMYPAEKHAHDIRINEYGHFLPSEVYFPNGIQPIADRCHELGLKLGIHLMRGIPRKAYDLDLPIKGTPYTARDIANTDPAENCTWCQYCYAVDMTKPGAQEWYDGLIQHIADMGVDFIKYDDIVPHPDEVAAVAKAIEKTGKPIVLSLSPGNTVDRDAIDFFKMANMLRVTEDVWDEQKYIDSCFKAWRKWQGKEEPGFWIDMDMIPFGQLQLMSPPSEDESRTVMDKGDVALAGKGTRRWSQLTKPQMRTFISMRALAASPLMMGGDLPTLDDYSLKLITDPEMLACNQNGVMAALALDEDGLETWVVQKRGSDSEGWLGVFNRQDKPAKVSITAAGLGLSGTGYTLKDVWNEKALNFGQSVQLKANDALFIKYSK
jgi:arylsulfatase A-like enzyme